MYYQTFVLKDVSLKFCFHAPDFVPAGRETESEDFKFEGNYTNLMLMRLRQLNFSVIRNFLPNPVRILQPIERPSW